MLGGVGGELDLGQSPRGFRESIQAHQALHLMEVCGNQSFAVEVAIRIDFVDLFVDLEGEVVVAQNAKSRCDVKKRRG